MKKECVRVLLLATAGSCLLSGCIQSHRAWVREPVTGEVVVTEAPPPPRTETMGTAPDAAHVWVEGYWTYADDKWVWIPGHWELRPRPDAVWVPGHWDKNLDRPGWSWTPGHWD